MLLGIQLQVAVTTWPVYTSSLHVYINGEEKTTLTCEKWGTSLKAS